MESEYHGLGHGLDEVFLALEVGREIGRHLRAGFDADEAMVLAWQKYPQLDESYMIRARDRAVACTAMPLPAITPRPERTCQS